MRWLVGWSSIAARFGTAGAVGPVGDGSESGSVHPVGSQLLWGDPDPLWAVGDWRPDEVRVVTVDPFTRLAVLGCCGATDEELRVGLFAARGGALRHLTAWPGSYTAVAQIGRRITIAGDLAGARPVFYTPWANGTAYATAALPLADLIEAQLDIGHLAALLACPETPEALRDTTPYDGVKRIPPGHALVLREGSREITGYEPVASLAVAGPQRDPDRAVEGVRDALIEAVRARLLAPRHAPETLPPDPGPVPGMGRPTGAPPGAGPSPASAPISPAAAPPAPSRCLPPGCPGRRARSWGTAPARGSGCSPSPSTICPPAGATEPNWNGPAPSPPTPGCTTLSSRPVKRPCRTPSWRARSPTNRGRPSSPPSGTAADSPRAAPTTSPAPAPAKCSTRIRRAWPICCSTGADAISCTRSARSPRPKARRPPRCSSR